MYRGAAGARLIKLATVVGLLGPLGPNPAVAAPEMLGEADLDRVQSGGVTLTAPAAIPAGSPVTAGAATASPPVGAPEGLTVNGRLEGRLGSSVHLAENAQRGIRALNLVNAAAADIGITANVLGSGGARSASGLAVAQSNDIAQLAHTGIAAASLSLPGSASRRQSAFGAAGTAHDRIFSDMVEDRFDHRSVETIRINARVPELTPAGNWQVDLDLGTMPDIALPDFGFDWTVGKEPTRFGVAAEFSGLALRGPGLSLGRLRADGDDLVINGGHITLPGIDLPNVRGELCAFECFSGSVSGTRVGNQTLSLDVGDIRLKHANPFKDIDLQLGQGIAAVGSGSFQLQGIGAEVTASLSFKLPSLGGQSISFDVIPSLGFMSDEARSAARKVLPDVPHVTLDLPEIELPSGSFELTLVDFDAPSYAGQFGVSGTMTDAVICLAVATTDCGEQSFHRDETLHHEYHHSTLETREVASYEEYRESEETRRRPGAEAADLRAETVTLAGSEAAVESYSVIVMTGNAQRDLRVFNLANATTAMVGSAANVLGTFTASSGRAARPANAVSQSNVFVQGFR